MSTSEFSAEHHSSDRFSKRAAHCFVARHWRPAPLRDRSPPPQALSRQSPRGSSPRGDGSHRKRRFLRMFRLSSGKLCPELALLPHGQMQRTRLGRGRRWLPEPPCRPGGVSDPICRQTPRMYRRSAEKSPTPAQDPIGGCIRRRQHHVSAHALRDERRERIERFAHVDRLSSRVDPDLPRRANHDSLRSSSASASRSSPSTRNPERCCTTKGPPARVAGTSMSRSRGRSLRSSRPRHAATRSIRSRGDAPARVHPPSSSTLAPLDLRTNRRRSLMVSHRVLPSRHQRRRREPSVSRRGSARTHVMTIGAPYGEAWHQTLQGQLRARSLALAPRLSHGSRSRPLRRSRPAP